MVYMLHTMTTVKCSFTFAWPLVKSPASRLLVSTTATTRISTANGTEHQKAYLFVGCKTYFCITF